MKTTEEIYNELKTGFEEASGLRLNDGGDMALRFYALAAQLSSLWVQSDYVNRQCFPQTAGGEALTMHAQMRGLERGGAVRASGTLRFSIPAALSRDLYIPENTRCMTQDGTEFTTVSGVTLSTGSLYCDAPAEAVEAGISGNVPAGSIVIMQNAPVGVSSCANPAAFTHGEDAEDDEKLRKRIMESYSSLPNGGNAAFYKSLVLDTAGVAAATVLPRARGRGTLDIIVASYSGIPSDSLLASVSAKLDERREICVDIDVSAPTAVTVNISAELEINESSNAAEVIENVETLLRGYFNGRLLGKSVKLAQLGHIIYSVDGVENYTITSPSADVSIDPDELPVLGTLTVSEAE